MFYPRYFELINDCVESFFADDIDWPFEQILKTGGIPTASIKADFKAVTRHGEDLDLDLTIERLGKTSLNLKILAHCRDEQRFEAHQTLVNIDAAGKPSEWPAQVKSIFLKN